MGVSQVLVSYIPPSVAFAVSPELPRAICDGSAGFLVSDAALWKRLGRHYMVVRNRPGYPWYVLAAVCGAVTGTLLLDIVARRIGEKGVRHIAGDRRFEYLKRKIGENGGIAVAVACLSPPPFPFTAVIGTVCALGYPRKKLLVSVAVARGIRFAILGALAIRYGRIIIRVANSTPFHWTMVIFIVICLVGSGLSLRKWFRRSNRAQVDLPQSVPR